MRIATWNVNSLKVRLEHLQKWAEEAKPDVVCLQETKCVDEQFPLDRVQSFGFPHVAFAGQKTYNGVAILSKYPIEDVKVGFQHGEPDAQLRLIQAKVQGVQLIDCYVPNGHEVGSEKFMYKLAWLARLREELIADFKPDQPLLLCGDLNIALTNKDVWDPFEAEGELLFHPQERAALGKVMEWGLADAYRKLKPDGKEFSWWDYRMLGFQKNRGFRIDHIFLTAPLLERCKDITLWRPVRKWEKPSDHIPVSVDLDV